MAAPQIDVEVTLETVSVEATFETVEVEVSMAGPAGPQGPIGPQGPSGTGDKHYETSFSAAQVTVNHNLGKYPAVTIFTTAGDEVEGEVEHLSTNQLVVSFSNSFSGVVICN